MRLASLLVLLLAGCTSDEGALPPLDALDLRTTTISALDSLAAEGPVEVSVGGQVSDAAAGSRALVLDDGTGLVRVRLPETPPDLVGHRLFVRGVVEQEDGQAVLEAVEWLYDSTAVSSRSE